MNDYFFFKPTLWTKPLYSLVPVWDEKTKMQDFYCKVEYAKGWHHHDLCSICGTRGEAACNEFMVEGSRKRQREKWMQNLNFCQWNCAYSPLNWWTSVKETHLRPSHVPPHHLPLLVRVAHSTLMTMNLVCGHKAFFKWPLRSIRLMGVLFCHGLLLTLRYTATLKHWSDHVLTNSACVYMILFNFFLPSYNLLTLFVQFLCLAFLNKLFDHSSAVYSCCSSSKEFTQV